MTTSAGDQINGALRLIGQLAEGETPSAATSADALTALNQMLDSWSAERLSVFSTQDQVFTGLRLPQHALWGLRVILWATVRYWWTIQRISATRQTTLVLASN